jgi:hypothetical protein
VLIGHKAIYVPPVTIQPDTDLQQSAELQFWLIDRDLGEVSVVSDGQGITKFENPCVKWFYSFSM